MIVKSIPLGILGFLRSLPRIMQGACIFPIFFLDLIQQKQMTLKTIINVDLKLKYSNS